MEIAIENQIRVLLIDSQKGDQHARDQLFSILYQDLKQIASFRLHKQARNITAQTTEIVNDLYIKFNKANRFPDKSKLYFFSIAAIAIEQIIIDYVRQKSSLRRGGNIERVEFDDHNSPMPEQSDEQLVELGQALQQLKELDPVATSTLSLKLFVGLQLPEISEVLNISIRTASRKWAFAKSYLRHSLQSVE